MENSNKTGALLDPRPESEKLLDWQHETIIGATPLPDWKEKNGYKLIETRDQGSALDCGAHAGARAIRGQIGGEMKSALPIYWGRTNVGGGMYHKEVLSLANKGTVNENQIPSQNLNETQANNKRPFTTEEKSIIDSLKGNGYVFCSTDINTIAGITDLGIVVSILIFFKDDEWKETLNVIHSDTNLGNSIHHFIDVVDYTLKNGKKYLVVEDSSNLKTSKNKTGQRLMSEEFANKRIISAGYLLKLPTDEYKNLVTALQKYLVGTGELIMPVGVAFGRIGPITYEAIKKHQGA